MEGQAKRRLSAAKKTTHEKIKRLITLFGSLDFLVTRVQMHT